MSAKHAKKGRRNAWRRASRPFTAGDWLVLFALIAVIAALAWTGTTFLPREDAVGANSPVAIRRVMTSNPSACFSVGGKYYDWLELENLTGEAVSLKGWRLSDTADQRGAFAFGDVTLPGRGSLIVYCDDVPEDFGGSEVFSGFKLSSDGELLVLSDARRRLMQTLTVPSMAASQVYERMEGGEYRVVNFAQMATEGAVDLTPAFDPGGVTISEVMASNRTVIGDEDGDWSDWLELYNPSSAPVDLTGCALSDDDVNQRKWVLPPLTLGPGEYRVIFASGKDRREGEALHTNFKLSTSGEKLRLYDPEGNVMSWVEYDSLPKETSLSRLDDGTLTTELRPTPGYENTEAGARAALTLATENPDGLYINEIMSSGSGDDWLELYNASGKPVSLAGMGLSDSTDRPRRWQFPDGAKIPAHGYVTVQLTGKEGETGVMGNRFCANFSLSEGETATLAHPDGTLIDRVTLFEQFRNVSYGRAEGQERYRCFADPTPGAANAAASYTRKAADVTFSQSGGCHGDKRLTVEMSSDEGVTIYYTTDGTEPTTKSKAYKGPLELKGSTVVKAVAWSKDVIPSDMAVCTFVLGVEHTVRLVSISGQKSQLDGRSGMLNTGIKGNGAEVFVEVYEPDGTRVIAQKCLMKLAGHSTREHEGQKGFSLRAKKEYGEGHFKYPLFTRRDYPEYKSFVMRASGQDCRQSFMRDSILSALAADTSVMYRETEVSVVYVNGRYWGVYNMRERISDDMIAQFHGWEDPHDVEMGDGSGTSNEGFTRMMSWVRSHDLANEENLRQLRQMVDVENYLEYVILEIYANNQDLGNVAFYRNPKADNLWRWALFDLDLSFQLSGNNVTAWLHGSTVGSITEQNNLLFRSLMRNAGMRDWFLRRFGELLATTFSAESVTGRIQERFAILEPEMPAECKRWDWTLASWKHYGKKITNYAKERPRNLIGFLTDDFNLNAAQVQDYFGDALAKIG